MDKEFERLGGLVAELKKPGRVFVMTLGEMWVQAVKADLVHSLQGDVDQYGPDATVGCTYHIHIDEDGDKYIRVEGY